MTSTVTTPPEIARPVAVRASTAEAVRARCLTALITLTLTGYPLLGTIVAFTAAPSLAASIPVRLLVLWHAFALMRSPVRGKGAAVTALHAFWFIYLLRLVFDIVTGKTPGSEGDIVLFVIGALLPAIGAARTSPVSWDERRIAGALLMTGAATCALALLTIVTGFGAGRSLLADTGRLSFDTVNPITYGNVAATTILAGLLLMPRVRHWASKAFVAACMIVAVLMLQFAASRGPAISLIAGLLAYVLVSLRGRRRVAVLLMLAAALGFMALTLGEGSEFTQRFSNVEEDQSTLVRLLVQTNAIDQFLGSPLTGSAHLELETLNYPHNPFIEAAMATGVLGLALYVFLNCALIVRIIRTLRSGNRLVAVLGVQYFVGAQFSGSLFEAGALWIFTAMLLPTARSIRAGANKASISRPAVSPTKPSIPGAR